MTTRIIALAWFVFSAAAFVVSGGNAAWLADE